jgi:hypothetical protein
MKFILATCVRNEGPYLLEWVAHYKLLGFDRIVIYSNDNTDGSDQLLAELQQQQLIEWRPRTLAPGESPQLSAYKAFSEELFSNPDNHSSYLAWLDCDEFLILKSHNSVQDLLSHYQFPDSLFVNWKHFGSSAALKYEAELTVSRFSKCDSTTRLNKFGKCISRVDPTLFKLISNHRPIPLHQDNYGRIIYASNQTTDIFLSEDVIVRGVNPTTDDDAPIFHDVCQLNHYAIRSDEEYAWKSMRGNGRQPLDSSKGYFPNSYFVLHDLNSEQDTLAEEKYAAAIKHYLAELPVDLTDLETQVVNKAIKQYRAVNDDNGCELEVAINLFHTDLIKNRIKKMALNTMPEQIQPGAQISISGVVVPKIGMFKVTDVILSKTNQVIEAPVNLPSPIMEKQFPNNIMAKNSRFQLPKVIVQIEDQFQLLARFSDNQVVAIADIKIKPRLKNS